MKLETANRKRVIKEKALEITNYPDSFKASKGWFEKFFERYNLDIHNLNGKELPENILKEIPVQKLDEGNLLHKKLKVDNQKNFNSVFHVEKNQLIQQNKTDVYINNIFNL